MADRELLKTTNRELVQRCAEAGPEDSVWPEFFQRFHARLRLVVYRALQAESRSRRDVDLGSPATLVEDLVQEVYLKLLSSNRRALSRFEGRSENSIYTYLASIAVNVTRDHVKKLRAQKSPPAPQPLDAPLFVRADGGAGPTLMDGLRSGGPSPEQAAADEELRRRAEAAVAAESRANVSRRDVLVYRLYFIEGLTAEEIAACGGIELSTSGVEKCVKKLREILQKTLGAELLEGGLRRKRRL